MGQNLGTITFRNARVSGILFKQLGSGVPDYLGMFGAGGTSSAIEVNSFQDTSIMVDVNGAVPSYLGQQSGRLTNCKWTGANTVRISGLPLGPYNKNINQVNVFNAANLTMAYPNFRNRGSGTLLIQYRSSGVSKVHTYNAKLWAYDRTGALTDSPPDSVWMAFEINASGQTYSSAYSGVWTNIAGQNNALFFANHSPSNGWRSEKGHIFIAAITAKPTSVGQLNDIALGFQLQYV